MAHDKKNSVGERDVPIVAALRLSYPVSMPLVVAIFVITAIWPIKPWLERFLPTSLSYVDTVLVLFLILTGFVLIVYLAVMEVAQTFAQNQERFRRRGVPRGMPIHDS